MKKIKKSPKKDSITMDIDDVWEFDDKVYRFFRSLQEKIDSEEFEDKKKLLDAIEWFKKNSKTTSKDETLRKSINMLSAIQDIGLESIDDMTLSFKIREVVWDLEDAFLSKYEK